MTSGSKTRGNIAVPIKKGTFKRMSPIRTCGTYSSYGTYRRGRQKLHFHQLPDSVNRLDTLLASAAVLLQLGQKVGPKLPDVAAAAVPLTNQLRNRRVQADPTVQ